MPIKPVGDGHLTAALVVPKSPPPKNNQETTWVSNIINYDSCGGVLDTFTASHEQFVTAMKWSPRGMFLALGFQTGKVRVLDPKRQWEVMMDIQLPHGMQSIDMFLLPLPFFNLFCSPSQRVCMER